MGWLSSAIGAVGNIWSANQANSAAFEMQANSIAAQKEAMQNKHQWEVEDLKKAGLNPILSANSAAGGISGATANITAADVAGGLLKGANSAQSRKATELMEKELQVRQTNASANVTSAEAKKLEAENDIQKTANDTARTNSSVSLMSAQTSYTNKMLDYTDVLLNNEKTRIELEKAMNAAQISKIEQDKINATLEVYSQIALNEKLGNAAVMNANASLSQANSAAQNAISNRMLAETAERNGLSERQLKEALSEKGRAETAKILQDKLIDYNKNPLTSGKDTNTGLRQAIFGAGEIIRSWSPLSGFIK